VSNVAPPVQVRPITRRASARYRTNPPPRFPAEAKRLGEQGVVWLTVSIDAAGHVTDASLKTSCGFKLLDDSALTTVRSWEFDPEMRGDTAVPCVVIVPIRFDLD